MNHELLLRRAHNADADAILKLLLQVEAIHQKGRPDLFRENGVKFTLNELLTLFGDDTRPIFVAEREGVLCGYLFGIVTEIKDSTMLLDRKTLHIEDVCIDEAYRGEGIGGALMEYAEEWARAHDFDSLDLDVWEFNEGARRFYERYGFSTQKRRMDKRLK